MPNENKLPAISSKDLNYLRNIHIMRSIFLVVSVDYFFGDILDRKLLLKEFPANESVFRLLKRDTFVEIFGGQPGVMHLVHFPAGFGSQNVERRILSGAGDTVFEDIAV